jgi:mRNA interferase MazF
LKPFEVWWAALPEPIGRRPVLLLTRAAAFDYLAKVIVVEITSTVRGIPQEVALGEKEGLRRRSVANFDNVHVIAKASLRTRIGALPSARIRDVKRALGYALDWPELKVL